MATFLIVFGCRSATRSADPSPKPTAEERLERLVRALKRDLEQTTAWHADGLRSGKRTLLTIKQTVHEELFSPRKADDVYTARITVNGTTLFATSRPSSAPDQESPNGGRDQRQAAFDTGDESGDSDDNEVDVAKLLGKETDSKSETKRSDDRANRHPTVRQTSDDWTKKIDLEYVDERWRVQGEIEDEVLASFVESALRHQ